MGSYLVQKPVWKKKHWRPQLQLIIEIWIFNGFQRSWQAASLFLVEFRSFLVLKSITLGYLLISRHCIHPHSYHWLPFRCRSLTLKKHAGRPFSEQNFSLKDTVLFLGREGSRGRGLGRVGGCCSGQNSCKKTKIIENPHWTNGILSPTVG